MYGVDMALSEGRESEQPLSALIHENVPLNIDADELGQSESQGEVTEKQRARCCACGLQFESLHEMKKHLTEHHFKNVTYQKLHMCKICGKLYAFASLLKRHSLTHANAQMFSCDRWGQMFERRDSLDTHNKNKHPTGHRKSTALQCPTCNKLFGFPSILERHVRTHSASRSYKCPDCDMQFGDAGEMHRHKLTSHSKMPVREVINHECPVCKRWFAYKSQLLRHSSVHTGRHPYACTLCDRSYLLAAGLRDHEQTEHREGQTVVDVSGQISEQQRESKN
ncbi:zinc finger, C2H2 type [Opisthorchis viverrini]|uniref:Zinc finger, C2H2 type n=1 Tax=Opisthorchis viverrini TaxID=6198 RepID=A0A1S8X5R9_OPIVI|nr:zinc finger, C2H2 type [Opisthorchis viverrini]